MERGRDKIRVTGWDENGEWGVCGGEKERKGKKGKERERKRKRKRKRKGESKRERKRERERKGKEKGKEIGKEKGKEGTYSKTTLSLSHDYLGSPPHRHTIPPTNSCH